MRYFITGAAGFIGSTLVDRLLAEGHSVVGYDNFSTGFEEFLQEARKSGHFTLIRGDVLDAESLRLAMQGCELIFHFSANADVRFGLDHPRKDLEQNILATFNVLEAMRANGINKIVFPSTGSVYGEPDIFPTPEDAAFPVQTSLYGASKLAAEGLISAYCEGFGFQAWIFRFVSILGERYTHGHVIDFYRKLLADPQRLEVLGNGLQKKSYLNVQDCIDAMLVALNRASGKVNIFNLGTDEYCKVNDSVSWISGHLKLRPELTYTGEERGWPGDSPFIFLDCSRLRALGWRPRYSIQDSIISTLDWLIGNKWVLNARP